ncbi:hypothetical protein ADUPG1_011565, partial [Aduncisulcus paluster]
MGEKVFEKEFIPFAIDALKSAQQDVPSYGAYSKINNFVRKIEGDWMGSKTPKKSYKLITKILNESLCIYYSVIAMDPSKWQTGQPEPIQSKDPDKIGKTTKTDIRSHMSMPALEPLVLDSILVSTPARSIVYIVCAKKRERKRLMEGAQQGILLFGMHLGSRTWKLVDVSMSFCKKTKQDHKLHPPSSLAYDTKGSLCSSAGMSVDRGCVRVINKKDSPVIVYVDMIERMCIFSRDSGHNWSHKVINSRMLPAFGPLHVVRSNGDKDTGSFLSLQPRGQILKFGNTGLLRWRIRNNSSMLKSKKNDFSSICGAHGVIHTNGESMIVCAKLSDHKSLGAKKKSMGLFG